MCLAYNLNTAVDMTDGVCPVTSARYEAITSGTLFIYITESLVGNRFRNVSGGKNRTRAESRNLKFLV